MNTLKFDPSAVEKLVQEFYGPEKWEFVTTGPLKTHKEALTKRVYYILKGFVGFLEMKTIEEENIALTVVFMQLLDLNLVFNGSKLLSCVKNKPHALENTMAFMADVIDCYRALENKDEQEFKSTLLTLYTSVFSVMLKIYGNQLQTIVEQTLINQIIRKKRK